LRLRGRAARARRACEARRLGDEHEQQNEDAAAAGSRVEPAARRQ
jgi:hypothetical protein